MANEQTDLSLDAAIKIYYDLYLPGTQSPSPLLIGVHGYGANKQQMLREARQMAPETFAIAAPQGFHQHLKEPREAGGPLRFGFGWLTSYRPEESIAIHHQALLEIIDRLEKQKAIDPKRVFLLGFSQSCALNYRFAFTYPERLRGVIGICGGLPGDWETSNLYRSTKAAVFHLAGAGDEFYTPARVEDYAQRLRVRAQDVNFQTYDAGHEIIPQMRADVNEWLTQHDAVSQPKRAKTLVN